MNLSYRRVREWYAFSRLLAEFRQTRRLWNLILPLRGGAEQVRSRILAAVRRSLRDPWPLATDTAGLGQYPGGSGKGDVGTRVVPGCRRGTNGFRLRGFDRRRHNREL